MTFYRELVYPSKMYKVTQKYDFSRFGLRWNKSLSQSLEKVEGTKSEGEQLKGTDGFHASTFNSSLQATNIGCRGCLFLQRSFKRITGNEEEDKKGHNV